MSYEIQEHAMMQGDTLNPIGGSLVRSGSAVDLTGLTVVFRMIAKDGTTKVNNQAATIVSAAAGTVQYTFDAADVDTPGEFWGWFIVFDGTPKEHFPCNGRKLRIMIRSENQ